MGVSLLFIQVFLKNLKKGQFFLEGETTRNLFCGVIADDTLPRIDRTYEQPITPIYTTKGLIC